MQTKAVVLTANNSTLAATTQVFWSGGRASIVINATTYPTTCQLQLQGPSGAWININSSSFAADQVTQFDLTAGNYRLNLSGGSISALYANLVSCPYG